MNDALSIWKEKLKFLQANRAIVADPSQQFSLDKQIEDARGKIAELESQIKEVKQQVGKLEPTNDKLESPDVPPPGDSQESQPRHEVVMKVVVVVDLARYSDIARLLQQQLGPRAVAELELQVQRLIDEGLAAVNIDLHQIPFKSTGDGAIIVLDDSGTASRFAEQLHRIAEKYNRQRSEELAQRHFRVGIWSDEVFIRSLTTDTGHELGLEAIGIAISNAVRLEGACATGEVLIGSDAWADLSREDRRAYGKEEEVKGKREEMFRVHRRRVVDPAPWETDHPR